MRRPWRQGIVWVAYSIRTSVAQAPVEILQVVVVSDIDSRARMRKPCEQCLRAQLLLSLQRSLGGIHQRRVILNDYAGGEGTGELIVELGAKGLAFVDQRIVCHGAIAIQQVGIVG